MLGLEEGGQPWAQNDGRKRVSRKGTGSSSRRGASPPLALPSVGCGSSGDPGRALSLLERTERRERASRPCGQLTRGRWWESPGDSLATVAQG